MDTENEGCRVQPIMHLKIWFLQWFDSMHSMIKELKGVGLNGKCTQLQIQVFLISKGQVNLQKWTICKLHLVVTLKLNLIFKFEFFHLLLWQCYTSTYANQQLLYSSFHHELKSSTNCIDILLWFPFNLWMKVGIVKNLNAWASIAWLLVLACNLIAYKKSSSIM